MSARLSQAGNPPRGYPLSERAGGSYGVMCVRPDKAPYLPPKIKKDRRII